MRRGSTVVRKNVMLEPIKVRRLVARLGAKSESEAIRIAIDDFLFAEEVMTHVHQLRRRASLGDAYRRARAK